jgi:hypothetical protein
VTNILRFYFAILGLPILLISDMTFSYGQVDPTKTLIGTWDGQIEAALSGGNQRTLMINSVTATGPGAWLAHGRFGFTGQLKEGPGGQEMAVAAEGNDIFVEFAAVNSRSPVKLKLVGDNKLEGSIGIVLYNGRMADRRIRLEKASPKTGDTK